MEMTPQAWPDWYDGRHINEVLFCQQFLDKHPMKCVRGRLFTVDGLIEDEGQIGNLILEEISGVLTSGLSKVVINLLASIKLQAYSPPLPIETAIERGVVRFIGSTTENPLVSMTPAIVSRCRIFEFRPLSEDDVILAMRRALSDRERGFGKTAVEMDEDAMRHIARVANGDVRSALGAVELAVLTTPPGEDGVIHVTLDVAEESIQKPVIRCDESLYYDMLSAFCKSLRGSDSDAALAWFARLLYAGVDPRLIVRRIIAHASEDVGLANPTAMLQAVAAAQALETVGLPEARLSMAQAIIAVCESPKSNSVVVALDKCVADAEKGGFGAVPIHLRDTHYAGHERLGSGVQYKYPHDYPGHYVRQEYMPPEVKGHRYYIPSDQGQELKLRERRRQRGVVDPEP